MDCRFHLATCVGDGKFIISTVGEYLPDGHLREQIAASRGIELQGKGNYRRADYLNQVGWEEVACGRKYETYVFRAQKQTNPEGLCCPYEVANHIELEGTGYNDPAEAYRGHMKLCKDWDK